jgi:hypothetical protein
MEYQPDDNALLASARLKDRSDNTLLRKVQTAQKVYWAGSGIITIIAVVAIWITTIRHDVDTHDKAIRKLWEHVFGYPLP